MRKDTTISTMITVTPPPNKKIEVCNFQAQTQNVSAASVPYLITRPTDTVLCNYMYRHDFGLQPRGKGDLCSSGMLRSFNGQEALVCLISSSLGLLDLDCVALPDGTDRLFRNVGT